MEATEPTAATVRRHTRSSSVAENQQMTPDEDAEIVEAFLEESRENLDQLDQDLVALEASPGDTALLARVFRTIHTIKGTCGFLGYQNLETMSHAGENLLG